MSDVPVSLFVLDLIPTQSLDLISNSPGLYGQDFSQVLQQQVGLRNTVEPFSVLPVTTIGPLEELVIYEVPFLNPQNALPTNIKPVGLNPDEQKELVPLQNKIPFLELGLDQAQVRQNPVLPNSGVAAQLIQAVPVPVPNGLPGGKELPDGRGLLPRSPVNIAGNLDSSPANLVSAAVEGTPEQPTATVRQDPPPSILSQDQPTIRQVQPPATVTPSSIGEVSQTVEPQATTQLGVAESRGVTTIIKTPLLPNVPPQQQQTWQTELSQRILWLTESKTPVATLRLNPPELGLVEVRVSVSQDQAAVSFAASSPEVRSAIEAALPRLHGLFQQNGMDLSHTDVGQHQDPQAQTSASSDGSDYSESEPEPIQHESAVESEVDTHRILDVFI